MEGVLTLPGFLDGDDAGVYVCKGINNVGEDSELFTLEVNSKSVIFMETNMFNKYEVMWGYMPTYKS